MQYKQWRSCWWCECVRRRLRPMQVFMQSIPPLQRKACLLGCRSDVMSCGCTSATHGPEFDAAYRAAPMVTAASAVIEALEDLGVERFAASSPYVASLE